MLVDDTHPGGDPAATAEGRPRRRAKKAAPTSNRAAKRPAGAAEPTAPRAKVAKVRVSALARELGRTSKLILARLAELDEAATSASSSVAESVAERVRESFRATDQGADAIADETADEQPESAALTEPGSVASAVLFVAPEAGERPGRRRRAGKAPAGPPPPGEPVPADADITVAEDAEDQTAEPEDVREAAVDEATGARRRRRRGRRGRGGAKASEDGAEPETAEDDSADAADSAEPPEPEGTDDADQPSDGDADADEGLSVRRRRRRRRSGSGTGDAAEDDPPNTITHVRETTPKKSAKSAAKSDGGGGKEDDGVRGVKGSTRLEARRQRRRDGRDTSRRRPAILTESEFLARREAVDRVMAVRQIGDRTQIAVLEDDVLVEHYVTRASAASYVGNVYLGRVQNVLPSMEAAFVDIGKGRNGVLYAGEVNWDDAGLEGKSRSIENAMKSGDPVLVQVTKDPIGHKGARLTSQVSLPGRFLVYVPGGGMTGISRRLPDTERHRLKAILKKIVPEDAGVIVRTAAEGASEQDLTHDVERLQAEWARISKKAQKPSSAPLLVHGEPDLAIRVVRDVFNEDFATLTVQGDAAWTTVSDYIDAMAPDLRERVRRHTGESDVFHELRVDEQLAKALDRKVYLPSGGSLVIDRTEAMTVIDVNTGKFVGSGGNLEQTVTRNNLEAAEEVVRQLRLRDVGGMIVIDFIDMVLESNRDLVLRRLTECLGRDRTKHQVAEVTSLGLVQMTRKRVGEGLLEAFSETCEVCHGTGVILHSEPVAQPRNAADDAGPPARRKNGGAPKAGAEADDPALAPEQRQKALAAMAAIHRAAHPDQYADDGTSAELELDAVETVLAGSPIDAELLEVDVADPAGVTDPEPQALPVEPEPPGTELTVGPRAEPEPPRSSRPRRRRSASRPAGPPAPG